MLTHSPKAACVIIVTVAESTLVVFYVYVQALCAIWPKPCLMRVARDARAQVLSAHVHANWHANGRCGRSENGRGLSLGVRRGYDCCRDAFPMVWIGFGRVTTGYGLGVLHAPMAVCHKHKCASARKGEDVVERRSQKCSGRAHAI